MDNKKLTDTIIDFKSLKVNNNERIIQNPVEITEENFKKWVANPDNLVIK